MIAVPLGIVLLSCSMVHADQVAPLRQDVSNLCDVLSKMEPGGRAEVTVRGVYVEGPETHVLYSTECDGTFQPSTWVEFSLPASDVEQLRALLAAFGRADVVLRGTLYGPRRAADTAPGNDAIARYGHLNLFRTKFVVREVVSAKGLAAATAPGIVAPSQSLRVLRGEMPLYPTAARLADVSGEVRLEVEINDGVVASVRTLSGSLLLAKAARENVQSWQFASGTTARVPVVYVFRLVDEPLEATRVEVDLPGRVTITESRSRW